MRIFGIWWGRERLSRIMVMTLGLYVFSQMWAQIAMELHFPMAITIGPVTAVLFWP